MGIRRQSGKGIRLRSSLMFINFFYVRKNNTRNGVGIVIGKDLKEKIIGIKRLDDRIIAIRLVLEEDIIQIIGAYAHQARLDESVKIKC